MANDIIVKIRTSMAFFATNLFTYKAGTQIFLLVSLFSGACNNGGSCNRNNNCCHQQIVNFLNSTIY